MLTSGVTSDIFRRPGHFLGPRRTQAVPAIFPNLHSETNRVGNLSVARNTTVSPGAPWALQSLIRAGHTPSQEKARWYTETQAGDSSTPSTFFRLEGTLAGLSLWGRVLCRPSSSLPPTPGRGQAPFRCPAMHCMCHRDWSRARDTTPGRPTGFHLWTSAGTSRTRFHSAGISVRGTCVPGGARRKRGLRRR